MVYNSCFDIIGPIMVGPSSSHTAGVVTIGKFVRDFLGGEIESATIVFYDSFSETYKGHGTDKAVVGGLLGLDTDDSRIRVALELAAAKGLQVVFEKRGDCPYYDHPNTVMIQARTARDIAVIGGVSLGGGISKVFYVNEFAVDIPLNAPYDLDDLRNKLWHNTRCEAAVGGA
ncbi:serine dehydratase beta chain [Brevibacillus parabrevis]|uniref:serine dehydratase beta chain n=1 Tax=Brevibacillus parabrevis TaxID=54914 RepID=UPI002E23C5CE|nr:serine dehydratase beta chain [Brevibacillus parabrevis]MED2256503.1 serine dehydratase beta chain [Brevibacillus parabrevis]